MRSISLVRRVALVAIGIAALVGIAFAAALIAIVSLRQADARESHSKDVTAATLRVRAVSADLDSALRGYALSGDRRFLTLFNVSRARVPRELGTLQALVHSDPPQSRRSLLVRSELRSYLTDYADNLITIARISHVAARGPAAGAEDKRRTDEIKATLNQILAAENRRAQKASAHARSVTNVAMAVGIATLAVSTALILLFGGWIARGVVRPVRRLASAAADVAGGDLSLRLEEGGSAEVGALVSAFNSMTRSLELARRELLTQNQQLREGERHKRDLISMISHELRTPLASVLGFTSLLLQRDFPHDEQRRYLEIVDAQARRLAALAGDFLDVQLLDGGALMLVCTPFDLAELVREQVQLFFLQLTTHRLTIDLPDAPLVIDGDRDRMSQVVGNLLSNAIKYSPEGGEVRVSARRTRSDAVVTVSDEGVGIRPEDTERIFEKFFRSAEATKTVGGTGLGLAVAREIVSSHGGRLEVSSTRGEGSTFVVTMPLQAPSQGSSTTPLRSSAPQRPDEPVDELSHETVPKSR
jgi:signal transduction histidine kinase